MATPLVAAPPAAGAEQRSAFAVLLKNQADLCRVNSAPGMIIYAANCPVVPSASSLFTSAPGSQTFNFHLHWEAEGTEGRWRCFWWCNESGKASSPLTSTGLSPRQLLSTAAWSADTKVAGMATAGRGRAECRSLARVAHNQAETGWG